MGERVIAVTWTTDWEIATGFAHGHRSLAVSAPVIASVALCQSGPTQLSTEVPTLTGFARLLWLHSSHGCAANVAANVGPL